MCGLLAINLTYEATPSVSAQGLNFILLYFNYYFGATSECAEAIHPLPPLAQTHL